MEVYAAHQQVIIKTDSFYGYGAGVLSLCAAAVSPTDSLGIFYHWNDVLRFEPKKLSGLEIYKISITHNLKDNNFNTYLYLQGGSS